MPQESPALRASAKKVLFMASRTGRPKEILDTPMIVLIPRSCNSWMTSSAVFAFAVPVLIVRVNGSTKISLLFIPYPAAVAIILSAMAIRSAAVSGMPSSSIERATRTAPYFSAIGNTFSRLSFFHLRNLKSAFRCKCA